MNFKLQREPSANDATYGKLSAEGSDFGSTLEDQIRELPRNEGEKIGDWYQRWKLPGRTCIPAGRYRVILDYSNRFKRLMPHILDLVGENLLNESEATADKRRGFTGIRIHSGNTAAQTEGCPLIGMERQSVPEPVLVMSHVAYDGLFARMKECTARQEHMWIDVMNPQVEVAQ